MRLIPLELKHYDLVHRGAVDCTVPWQWHGRPPSPEAFQETLWTGVLCQFLFERTSDGVFFGLGTAYGANFVHQHCYVRAGIIAPMRHRGWPLEAGYLLVDHVFATYSVRKVCAEATSDTLPAFDGTRFDVEGRRRDHVYRGDGEFQDLYLLAVHRADWQTHRSRLRRMADGFDQFRTRTERGDE